MTSQQRRSAGLGPDSKSFRSANRLLREGGYARVVWELVASGTMSRRQGGTEPRLCFLPAARSSWTPVLESALDRLSPDETLIVAFDCGWRRAFLRLLVRRSFHGKKGPSVRQVTRMFREKNARVLASYRVWPAAERPRVMVPAGPSREFAWVHRTGVIGGGGHRLWMRALARSAFASRLVLALAPGLALLVVRDKGYSSP